jgi:hypothetical protein
MEDELLHGIKGFLVDHAQEAPDTPCNFAKPRYLRSIVNSTTRYMTNVRPTGTSTPSLFHPFPTSIPLSQSHLTSPIGSSPPTVTSPLLSASPSLSRTAVFTPIPNILHTPTRPHAATETYDSKRPSNEAASSTTILSLLASNPVGLSSPPISQGAVAASPISLGCTAVPLVDQHNSLDSALRVLFSLIINHESSSPKVPSLPASPTAGRVEFDGRASLTNEEPVDRSITTNADNSLSPLPPQLDWPPVGISHFSFVSRLHINMITIVNYLRYHHLQWPQTPDYYHHLAPHHYVLAGSKLRTFHILLQHPWHITVHLRQQPHCHHHCHRSRQYPKQRCQRAQQVVVQV